MGSSASLFMQQQVIRLLDRFVFSYQKEENCVEYVITEKATGDQISYSIVLSLNTRSKQIHVSRFWPELYKQSEAKYLSAACFCLVIHHFAGLFHLNKGYCIALETRPATYRHFFSKLNDFHIHNAGVHLCESVEVVGEYPSLDIDISAMQEKHLQNYEVPFQV